MLVSSGDRDALQLVDRRRHAALPGARRQRAHPDDPDGRRGAVRRPAGALPRRRRARRREQRQPARASPASATRPPRSGSTHVRRPRRVIANAGAIERQGGREPARRTSRACIRNRQLNRLVDDLELPLRRRRPRGPGVGPRGGAPGVRRPRVPCAARPAVRAPSARPSPRPRAGSTSTSSGSTGPAVAARGSRRTRQRHRSGVRVVGRWRAGRGDAEGLALATGDGAAGYVDLVGRRHRGASPRSPPGSRTRPRPKVLHDAKGPLIALSPTAGCRSRGVVERHGPRRLPVPARPAQLRPGRPHPAPPRPRAARRGGRAGRGADGQLTLEIDEADGGRDEAEAAMVRARAVLELSDVARRASCRGARRRPPAARGRAAARRGPRPRWSRPAIAVDTARPGGPRGLLRGGGRRPPRSEAFTRDRRARSTSGRPSSSRSCSSTSWDAEDQADEDRLDDGRRGAGGPLRQDRAPVPAAPAAAPGRAPKLRSDRRGPDQVGRRTTAASTPRTSRTSPRPGRLSSTDPNLQNIPIRTDEGRRIRETFVVGAGYECLLTADYSQIEMRIMAHLSGDEGLIEAFRSGEDLHRFVGSRVFARAAGRGDAGDALEDQGDVVRPGLRPVRVRALPPARHPGRTRRAR